MHRHRDGGLAHGNRILGKHWRSKFLSCRGLRSFWWYMLRNLHVVGFGFDDDHGDLRG